MRAPTRLAGVWLLLAVLLVSFAAYAQATYSLNLPSQALSDSLRELGSQARINVIFDPAAIGNRTAPALKGSYELKQALAKLLKGTGFAALFTDATTVVIKPLPTPAGATPAGRTSSKPAHRQAEAPEAPTLKAITVLGSLIPRTRIETASPVVIITAEQMKNRGFTSVADALQNLNLNTGSAFNNTSISNMGGSTWATKTLSLFGLPPNYVKYLINGRPMAEYSQVVVGAGSNAGATPTDTMITNLAGIPIDLVDRIEILSGGQSSLYGSDAIAGVVNIVLKRHVNFATVDARYGYYTQGGGKQSHLSFTDGHTFGQLELTYGFQLDKQDPVFGSQRRYTAQNFAGNPNFPQQPSPVATVVNLATFESFVPNDNCDSLSGLFHGSVYLFEGSECGSVEAYSNNALITASERASASTHITYHLADHIDLYGNLFDSYQKSQQGGVVGWNSPLFYDVGLQAPVIALRVFAPSEVSSNPNGSIQGNQYENAINVNGGAKINFDSGWDLDLNYSIANDRITYRQYAFTSDSSPASYGARFLGSPVGFNPDYGLSEYNPDYNFLFSPITPAQYKGFIAGGDIVSSSDSDQFRAQLTQASLFKLPGGDAGLAIVAESGNDRWGYLPSEGFLTGQFYNYEVSTSEGHRNRYATAAELTLPVLKQLTIDSSARFDSYDAEGHHFEHPTYSFGLEFGPVDTLLLRAQYTTSFKAPELIQEFEHYASNSGIQVTDNAGCYAAGKAGYAGCILSLAPPNSPFVVLNNLSNPNLQAIQSKSVSYGVVWAPSPKLTASIDYQHLFITDQIGQQTAQSLVLQELDCLEGLYGLTPQSPSCVSANSQVTRTGPLPGWPLGMITQIDTLEYNIAASVNNSLTANLHYLVDLHSFGHLSFDGAYTFMLDDRTQNEPGDPYVNEFSNPVALGLLVSRSKANLAVNWELRPWSVTLFGTYIGRSPNYAAYTTGSYAHTDFFNGSQPDTLPPWTIWNLSVDYTPIRPLTLSLRVNNLGNSMPPIDRTAPGAVNLPFNPAFYNPYGRQVLVEAKYTF